MLFYLISCQCEPSSLGAHLLRFRKNIVYFTCLILLPSMFNSTSLILYFFPFGVNIVKFVFLVFDASLLALNQVQWNLSNTVTHGTGKSDLNGELTVYQVAKLHCGIQFGTAKG